jgi:hypothetical protein
MYDVLTGSQDKRSTHYIIMATTPRISDWYLYTPKSGGETQEAYIHQMAENDPIPM